MRRQLVDQAGLSKQHGNACVLQHERDPVARIRGIDGQVGAPGFENGQQTDHHLQRAFDANAHQ